MSFDSKIHRRRSVRLKNYDYSQNGAYFVTICCAKKTCFFGKIEEGKMVLNPLGKIAEEYWQKIGELHDFVILDAFIVMPNHIHGILLIDHDNVGARQWRARENPQSGACQWQAPTPNCEPTNTKNPKNIRNITLPPKGIPSIVNHYKGAVKKWANKNEYEFFSWQRNYHEHIIRNESSLAEICEYIIHNPQKWKQDTFFVYTS